MPQKGSHDKLHSQSYTNKELYSRIKMDSRIVFITESDRKETTTLWTHNVE